VAFGIPEKLGRRLALALAAAAALLAAGPAQAAVAYVSTPALTNNTWSGTGQTNVTLNTGTFTPPAGAPTNPNRLMVVVVTIKFVTGPISDARSYDVTGTFGTTPVQVNIIPAAKTGGAGTGNTAAVWIGYVKDASLTTQALSVTIASKGVNVLSASVFATFFSGVSQQWSIADGSSVNSASSPATVPGTNTTYPNAVYGPAGGAFLAAAASPVATAPNLPTPNTFLPLISDTTNNLGSRVAYKLSTGASELTSVSGTAPLALASIALNPDTYGVTNGQVVGVGDGTAFSLAPMVALLNPGFGAVLTEGSSGFKVQARVARPTGASNVTAVEVTWDGWITSTTMTWDPKYGGTQNQAGIWTKSLPPGTTGTGAKTLQVRATNAEGSVNSRPISITVNAAGGDGNLLVRDNSSQLCADCHTHPLHTSETAGNALGSWAIVCRDCHTPHATKNIFLIPAQITPPSFSKTAVMKTFTFYTTTGFATNGLLNSTFSGVCQNCHTRTTDTVGNPMFRNNAGYDQSHNPTQPCADCHSHAKGFLRPAVVACYDCHGKSGRTDGMPNAQVPPTDTCGNTQGKVASAGAGPNRVGTHMQHLGDSAQLHLNTNFGCTECHPSSPGTWHDTSTQANKCQTNPAQRANGGNFGPYWGPLARTGGTTPTYNFTSQTCSSVYCHGAFTRSGVASPQNITWNATISCGGTNACHKNSAGTSAAPTYPHPPRGDVTGSTCVDCHPSTSTPPSSSSTTHVNGTLDLKTYGCSQCHGELSTAGPNGVLLSSPTNAAPGATAPSTTSKDAAGNTATTAGAIGAHRAHLQKTNLRTAAIACTECHALPPSQTDTGHANGTSSVPTQGSRATLTFGTLAKGTIDAWNNGSTTTPLYGGSKTATLDPSGVYSTVAGSCSKVYCHGWFKNVGTAGTPPWDATYSWTTTACTSLPCATTTLTCTSCHNNGAGSPQPAGTHPNNTACTTCHAGYSWTGTSGSVDKTLHINGKQEGGGGGPLCMQPGCHSGIVGNRRNAQADFSLTSHHVGRGNSAFMGTSSQLTEKDCWVCHAEYDQGAGTTGDLHSNGLIDLRDADNATNFIEYDPSTIKNNPGTANSGNATWKQEMSGRTNDTVGAPNVACALPKAPPAGWTCTKGLDRFCLSCHDADGASASGVLLGDAGANPLNPFFDHSGVTTVISNERDQRNRGAAGWAQQRAGVVDIASRVADSWRNSAGGTYAAQERDIAAQPPAVAPTRASFGRNDPPEGVFSRHAIRGLSLSVYTTTDPAGNLDGAACYAGVLTNCFRSVNGNQWKSSSVMDCADCHTIDGANTVSGNAHGSVSEYMLKNNAGLATGPTSTRTTLSCAQCHDSTYYDGGGKMHTGSGSDWVNATGQLGSNRVTAVKGNIYGYDCGNCHGTGVASKASATLPPGSGGYGGFGTIHGTSQVIGIGTDGGAAGTAYRNAYRFLNGNSMRYYNPTDWTTPADRTCYTLTSAAAVTDGWGGCSQHSPGKTQTNHPALNRPLAY